MSVATKLGLLALAAAVAIAIHEFDLVGPHSTEATAAALQQFSNSDAAAEKLRLQGAAKNWWLLAVPAGLFVLAGLLFWDDFSALWRRSSE